MAGTAVDQCEGYDTHTLIWMDRCTGVKEQSPALGREAGTVTCEGRLLHSGASSPKECGIYSLSQADLWGATKAK